MNLDLVYAKCRRVPFLGSFTIGLYRSSQWKEPHYVVVIHRKDPWAKVPGWASHFLIDTIDNKLNVSCSNVLSQIRMNWESVCTVAGLYSYCILHESIPQNMLSRLIKYFKLPRHVKVSAIGCLNVFVCLLARGIPILSWKQLGSSYWQL